METILFNNIKEIKKEKKLLERKLHVKITIYKKKVTIDGEPMNEYEASLVLDAINFGFDARTALLLWEEDFMFRRLNIKDFTRRKNLSIVKARLIGTQGRTKKTLENLSDCRIIIKGNEIGIICAIEEMDDSITAMSNLIRGSKQSNVYKFLEKRNTQRKIINEK